MAVAKYGSFSSASEQLYLSKVSVMNQINALEARVGASLFERTNQGVVLTEAGRSLYKNLNSMIKLQDKALYEVRKLENTASRIIRVGTSLMRPCNDMLELWERICTGEEEYHFDIVPFSDDTGGFSGMLDALGKKIDCFVSSLGSIKLHGRYNFLPFKSYNSAITLSKKHPLSKKTLLTWEDLRGESLMLVKRGNSYTLDALRDDILKNHRDVNIIDIDGYYDISAFNLCEQRGYLMETLDVWGHLHPSLVTIPMDWEYKTPYGIIYEKEPSPIVQSFVDTIAEAVSAGE